MAETTKLSNRDFANKDSMFRAACEAVSVNPCGRQASKWRRRTGKAFKEGKRIVEENRSAAGAE